MHLLKNCYSYAEELYRLESYTFSDWLNQTVQKQPIRCCYIFKSRIANVLEWLMSTSPDCKQYTRDEYEL